MKKSILLLLVVVSTITGSYSQSVSDSLIIHYPFSGNALDISGNNNHGDVIGPILTTDRFGNANSAYDFDGVNDFVAIAPISDLSQVGDFTVAVWVNCDAWNIQSAVGGIIDQQYIFDGGVTYNYVTSNFYREGIRILFDYTVSFDELLHNTIIYDYVNLTNNYMATNTSLSLMGNWHFIVFQREGSIDKTYFDGFLITSTYSSYDQRSDILDMEHPLYIGSGYGANPNYNPGYNFSFDGKIDDFRFYKRALSAVEIFELYTEIPCTNVSTNDTVTYYVSSLDFISQSPLVIFESTDVFPLSNSNCDSLINNYVEFIFDPNYVTDTIQVYDTLLTLITDTITYIDSLLYIDTIFQIDTLYYVDSLIYIDTVIYIDSVTYIDTIQYFDTITYIDTIPYIDTIIYVDTVVVWDSISVTDTLIIDVVLEGITPPNNINTIRIYPNPAKDHVIINTGDYFLMTDYIIKIFNSNGQNVFESIFIQPEISIDVNDLGSNGIYFIQIYNQYGVLVETRKLIFI